jgi:hypothetical protein
MRFKSCMKASPCRHCLATERSLRRLKYLAFSDSRLNLLACAKKEAEAQRDR